MKNKWITQRLALRVLTGALSMALCASSVVSAAEIIDSGDDTMQETSAMDDTMDDASTIIDADDTGINEDAISDWEVPGEDQIDDAEVNENEESFVAGVTGSDEVEVTTPEVPDVQLPTMDDENADTENAADTEDESIQSPVTSELETFTFQANGGQFADGTDANTLTANTWTVKDGSVYSQNLTDNEADEAEETTNGKLFLEDEEEQLRYVVVEAKYQTGEGQGMTLADAEGKTLLDTSDSTDESSWRAILTEVPVINAIEVPDDVYGYSIHYTAIYSASGEGSYEEPSREGYRFAGWYSDAETETAWDMLPIGTTYAKWEKLEEDENYQTVSMDSLDQSFGLSEESLAASLMMASSAAPTTLNDSDSLEAAGDPVTDSPVVSDGSDETADDEAAEDEAANATTVNASDEAAETPDASTDEAAADQGQTVAYSVQHLLMETDGTSYTMKDTEHLTGIAGTQVTPTVKSYEGFISPNMQSAILASDGSTVVEYKYTRESYNFALTQVEGADLSGSTPSGIRYYGEEITLKCVPSSGYEFVQWSNGDKSSVTTFTMPAADVTVSPSVQKAAYKITYNLDGGEADNPTAYNADTDTFSLTQPTKDGYVFTGWTGANGDTPQTNVTINKGTSGNLTFHANWTKSGDVTPESETETETKQQGDTTLTRVQTGDTSQPLLFLGLAIVALALGAAAIIMRKKQRK